jgi:glycosyltransferase involved in cell wall biosynthesis
LKILLSAFSCAPGRGSEPGIGWGVVCEVAKRHQVWVLTQANNRPLIETALAASPLPRARFIYISLPWWPASLKTGWFNSLYYMMWQLRILPLAWQLQREIGFDLVHHVTYVNSWYPVWLGWLGVPFIWSADGMDRTPPAFLRTMSRRSRFYEITRNMLMITLGTITQMVTGRKSTLILTASALHLWKPSFPVARIALGGLPQGELVRLQNLPARPGNPVRFISIGRLLGWKGFDSGLKAFVRLYGENRKIEYWIVGEGPEQNYLEQLTSTLGCQEAVRFWGWRPREEVFQFLGNADVLMQPSLHDGCSYTVLEAMAAGRPVICLDVGGPAELMSDDGGVKIPLRQPEQVVEDLYLAMKRLALDSVLRNQMGEAARRHVNKEYRWSNVGRKIENFYEMVKFQSQNAVNN